MGGYHMTKKTVLSVIIILAVAMPPLAEAQFHDYTFTTRQIRLGIEGEFLDRLITWGEDQSETSTLRSYLFLCKPGYEIREGTTIRAILGYSLSNFNEMVFRELPFSLELDTGNIDGIALGGEALIRLIKISRFSISARAQFVTYIGFKDEWGLPGLNVEGTATGNPYWSRFTAGPKISYQVTEYLRPYLIVNYDTLWGKVKMKEEIEELTGEQETTIESKSSINFSIGTLYEIIDRLDLKVEAGILPFEEGVGLSIALGAFYSF